MKRTTSHPLVRQPRGLQPLPPSSPFKSHLPPAQRRQMESAALGKRVSVILTLVLAAGCVLSYFAYRANQATTRSLSAAKRTAQTFASDLLKHDYWNASAQLSPSAQRLHPAPAIKQEIAVLERLHGTIIGTRTAGAEPRSVAGLQTYRANYWLTCERGVTPLHIVLVRGYRTWSIESYMFG